MKENNAFYHTEKRGVRPCTHVTAEIGAGSLEIALVLMSDLARLTGNDSLEVVVVVPGLSLPLPPESPAGAGLPPLAPTLINSDRFYG